jgi:4-amino-4-deoxy-L-arabinose transferase-like glycosyltransferase
VSRRAKLAATLLILIGTLRIASTFRVFSETADEANHVRAGLELYQYHQYKVQTWNPPLPRIVLAAAPYAGGMRYDPNLEFSAGLRWVFFGHGKYEANLVRARVGNLLFFAIAAAGVWLLARRLLDDIGALLALLLFTTQPVILGYSGLATHDTPAVAGMAIALWAFIRWLDAPNLTRAAVLGVAYGFGALCKFSCITFVPAACGAIFAVRLIHDAALRRGAVRALATILAVPLTAALTIWAGYAFTFGKTEQFGKLPAPAFFDGITGILQVDRQGFLSYALGHTTTTGWWWYFPFAFLLKTTLALLVFLAIGAWFALRAPAYRWTYAEWTLATLATFLPALRSSLDLGVRYVLPAYVPFSIAAAAAAMAMLRSARRLVRYAALVLLGWHLVASTLAHPDYFPYFNEPVARNASHYLSDSNLDWGQDLLRLRRFCRRRGITSLPRALFAGDIEAFGLPPRAEIDWSRPPEMPAAVSESVLVVGRTQTPPAFSWADEQPYVRVGKTIRVYGLTSRNR